MTPRGTAVARPDDAACPDRSARARRVEQTSFALACLLLLALIAIRFAEPIKDGDLFWHMAYARQMLERHTLVPDPTIYSWTPVSAAMIYCAWLSELVLYGLWWLGGEGAMFVLRYAAAAAIVALLWHHAARFRHAWRAWTPLLILLVVLASAPVMPAKPELFSIVFTHLLLWLFAGARHADRCALGQDNTKGGAGEPEAGGLEATGRGNGDSDGGSGAQSRAMGRIDGRGKGFPRGAGYWLWAVPALMLVWVNSHGGFILAGPLMAAMLVGDLANRRYAPSLAFGAPARRTLWLAWIAAAAVTLFTPYGWSYPQQLLADYVFGATARPDVDWNNAHQGLFSAGGWALHLPEYGALMFGVLAWFAWRARRAGRPVDAVSVLLVLVALPLFVVYLRSSYLLPAVFGYVALAMLPRPANTGDATASSVSSAAPIAMVATVALAAALVARAGWEARCRPEGFSWWGFGIGHINPVEEAEWLDGHRLGERLYNIFDSGGYLLWRLHPVYRVMVDSRSYPYLGWFEDQYRFTMGQSFDSFLRRYPADVAVIDLAKAPAWRNFLRSPEWRPAFVGATAAVFVRTGDMRAEGIGYRAAAGLESIRNADAALRVFDFVVDAGDWVTAWRLADRLQGPLACQVPPRVLAAIEDHRVAYRLAQDGRYREAAERLGRALARKHPGERDQALLLMLQAMTVVDDPGPTRAMQIRAGLASLLAQRE